MNDVMQLETDEKEMRREISYEIKNQLGVRYNNNDDVMITS